MSFLAPVDAVPPPDLDLSAIQCEFKLDQCFHKPCTIILKLFIAGGAGSAAAAGAGARARMAQVRKNLYRESDKSGDKSGDQSGDKTGDAGKLPLPF